MKDTLIRVGLTSNEADVYLTLLQAGMSTASLVATEAGMHRTSVYSALARLEKKSLVSTVVLDGSKQYEAAHPKKIQHLVLEQAADIAKVIPALEEAHRTAREKDMVKYASGLSGIQSIHEEIIAEGKDFCGYGSGLRAAKVLRRYLSHFTNTAIARKINSKMVFSSRFDGMRENPFEERRYVETESFGPESVRIFGDRVAVMYFLLEEPFGIVIRHPHLVEGYLKRFEWLWERSLA